MQMRRYKDTHIKVSALGMGCMRLPNICAEKNDIDVKKAQAIIDYAYSHGINYYDTAFFYHGGLSESFLGEALSKYPRDSYFLATKMTSMRLNKPGDLEDIFSEQLRRCQTGYFDFYLLHAVKEKSLEIFERVGTYEFLKKKKEEGKIHRLGFSFHDTPEMLKKVCDKYQWDFAQIQLNYLDWEMQDAKGQYNVLEKKGIPCIVMEPLRGGILANLCEEAGRILKTARPDMSIASWGIRFAASLPNVLTVLSGMSSMEQIIDNVNTMSDFVPYTGDDYKTIEKALEVHKSGVVIPCTACRYCMEKCPAKIDIAKLFKLYNIYAVGKKPKELEDVCNASRQYSCIGCGRCAVECPQHIDIPVKISMIGELAHNASKS